jgi:putative PIN family toxin of toxin-antitoxin system
LRPIIIDANTLASGSINPHPEAPTSLIYHELTGTRVEVFVCPELLAEVEGTLQKPYFSKRLMQTTINDIVTGIANAGTLLPDPINPEPLLNDPKDDYLVALARIVGAEFIVSGDKHLLGHIGLEPPAINARNACELLGLIELR